MHLINFVVRQYVSIGRQGSHWLCGRSHKFNETRNSEGDQIRKVGVLGHLCGMQEQDSYRKLALRKPEGAREVGMPAVRWLDSEEDLKTLGFINWKLKSQNQDKWRAVVKETKVHDEW
jgi:hypothetical protein